MRLSGEAFSQFDEAIQKEWLITNGLGGYASSTVLGVNTRKYHGLLVAAFYPPGDRRVCLAKLDEELVIGNSVIPLNANEFQSGIFPKGYLSLKEFQFSPFPKYVYATENVEIQKTIFMPHERNVTITVYNVINRGSMDIKVQVFPLINCRYIHAVTDRWKSPWQFAQKQDDNGVNLHFTIPQSAILIKTTRGKFHADGKWIERLYYREEATRGESSIDDCYQPGHFEANVKARRNDDFAIIAVAEKGEANALKTMDEMPLTMYDIEAFQEREIKRQESLLTRFYERNERAFRSDWLDRLLLATDMFIVKGEDDVYRSVIAGYHWFETWGRDTFVAVPGLMLVTGRFEDAKKVFQNFRNHCKQGLIPNFIPEQHGEPSYNTVDATLWFLNAILQYVKYTGGFKFAQEQLWDTLKTIIENHEKGTLFDIHVDGDGLLLHGPQLTWMDAAVDGQPVTPRAGKAVEIQALWYNALKIMELLAGRFKETSEAEKYVRMAEKAKRSFTERFWNLERNCLFDVVGEHGADNSLRPNQIIAVSLDFVMLDNEKGEAVVDVVRRELLTPYGLRTLDRNDARYVGVYAGDRRSRDRAYHNGTVWAWLLGPFTTAYLKTKGYAEYRRDFALKNFLLPLFTEQLFKAGLGTVSEIFDGESSFTPRGCIAQAWSVAEPLRAYIEDVIRIRPLHEKKVLQGLG
jgi:predicted glycogen debranching enzyme